MKEPKILDFNGAAFSLSAMAKIMYELETYGCVTVKGINPGSVNLLSIGATLAEMARDHYSPNDLMKRAGK